MEENILKEFNKELRELLKKYNVALTIEEVPATKRISVAPIKPEPDGTPIEVESKPVE